MDIQRITCLPSWGSFFLTLIKRGMPRTAICSKFVVGSKHGSYHMGVIAYHCARKLVYIELWCDNSIKNICSKIPHFYGSQILRS